MSKEQKSLLLENQICFPLYAASRLIIQAYREPLEELGITYPQYLVMLVLWEKDGQAVNEIGKKLLLDSGTLTPLLKRLETNNLIKRVRSDQDERKVEIELTFQGKSMKSKAEKVPEKIMERLNSWEPKELDILTTEINKLVNTLNQPM
ncbi:MarR family winged helix-turn-helix transcriptional regulator [Belliella aquatica]|uniref:HTH-type transcriptional regulator SarZ n=1 Tax=Belliella aquatica TaxID=1323734 RepID=A0ABQ1MSG8_9BACT|nr:MarR family transcriptional regulator [Belliella aquatica]MCH7405937.1 MarR family transcriptional regulator [Belliella aquatica]GGC43992.1 MarR family transcriptional regulator [Belliella aquatica]